jgi:protein-disulfide isomerase
MKYFLDPVPWSERLLRFPLPSSMSTPSPSASRVTAPSPWIGFAAGAVAGFVCSIGLAGLMIGYSMGLRAQGGYAPSPPAPSPQAQAQAPAAAPAGSKDAPPLDARLDHIRGNPKAAISVIEYSDFECPFCKRHAPTMAQVLSTYTDGSVNVVFRHFPLPFHQNAQKEAEASECVAELGGNDAFWSFHDKIFDRTTSNGLGFALDKLGPLAKEIGVDQAKFQACLDSGKYAQKVKDQAAGGAAAGIHGTPGTIVLNNATKKTAYVVGAVAFSSFQTAIESLR